jgi:hypothetical protein
VWKTVSGRRIVQAMAVAFLGIGAGGAVLILAWAPTVSSYRLVAFLASMFPLTGAVVVAVLLWAIQRP